MAIKKDNYPQAIKSAVLSFIEYIQAYLKYDETKPLKDLISKYLLFYLSVSERSQKILKSTNSEEDKTKQLQTILLSNFSGSCADNVIEIAKITDEHPWHFKLNEHKHHILFYIFNEDQLFKLTPLIKSMDYPILLLTEFEIFDDIVFPDNVCVLDFDFSLEIAYRNDFLETNFPILYYYLNSFEQLFQLLLPLGTIVWGGHLFQQEALSVVAQNHGLKTIRIADKITSIDTANLERNNLYNCNFILHDNHLRKEGEYDILPLSYIQTLLQKKDKD